MNALSIRDTKRRSLSIAAIAFALLFLALYIPFHPYPGSFLIKAVPVACLVALSLLYLQKAPRILFTCGLFFSLLGDVVLDLDRARFFILGLLFFLIAHIFYAILFIRQIKFSKKAWPIIFGISLYALILAFLLRNMDLARLPAVLVYLLTISLMSIFAGLQMTHHSYSGWSVIVFVGALVFMISDTIIAVNQFLQPIPYSLMYSLSCYWTAQFLLVLGMLRKPTGISSSNAPRTPEPPAVISRM